MKKVWKLLTFHLQQDFHVRQYLSVAFFLACCLSINYSINFENGILDRQEGFLKFLYFFLTYAFAYYFVLATTSFFKNEKSFWHRREFIVKSLLVLIVLSLDSSMPYLKKIITYFFVPEVEYWIYKIGNNICSLVIIPVPLLIYYWMYDRREGHVYGLRARRFDYRPYFVMLLFMLPLIAIATTEGSFIRQYPMYKTSSAHVYLHKPEWYTALIYEVTYALDFITVEFLFRGFMIIGMMNVLGRNAVLPMAAAYCFIHFGKPPGEAISSIFGGYILGVIALETKSIWGGIIVHIGIAIMMEVAAYLVKL